MDCRVCYMCLHYLPYEIASQLLRAGLCFSMLRSSWRVPDSQTSTWRHLLAGGLKQQEAIWVCHLPSADTGTERLLLYLACHAAQLKLEFVCSCSLLQATIDNTAQCPCNWCNCHQGNGWEVRAHQTGHVTANLRIMLWASYSPMGRVLYTPVSGAEHSTPRQHRVQGAVDYSGRVSASTHMPTQNLTSCDVTGWRQSCHNCLCGNE